MTKTPFVSAICDKKGTKFVNHKFLNQKKKFETEFQSHKAVW